MNKGELLLSAESFKKIFPFFMRLDKDLKIVEIGSSMEKVMGKIQGSHFQKNFKTVRPKLSISCTYDSFLVHQDQVIIIETINTPILIKFRGQFIVLMDELYYLSSPWITDSLDLSYHNLLITDFAIHDTITDNLQLLKSKEIVNEDMKRINAELTIQRDELIEKNMLIEELARFPDQNPQPVLRLDFEGKLLYSNDAADELINELDLLKKPFWSTVYPKFASNGFNAFEREIKIGDRVLHATLVPFMKRNYFNLYIRDISEIVKYQHELITSNSRLNSLINSMQSGVLAEDMDRKIILVNQRFCDIFMIPVEPSTMKGLDCTNAAEQSKVLFSNEEEFVARIDQILKKREPVFGEQIKMKSGRILERDYIPIYDEDKYQGHIWKYQDITEILMSKESLRKVEDKYRKIIEALDFGLIEVDMNEIITKVYPAFCKMTGFSENELLGQNPRIILATEDDLIKLDEQIKLREKGISGVYEVRIRTKDNQLKWWIISGTPIFDEENKVVGSLGVHLDISERKELENELFEAKEKALSSVKAKEMFLANMSHEIRTPINVMIGMTELLQGSHPNEEQSRYISALKVSAENLISLINDVLDFSKIEAGYISIEKRSLDLKALLEQVKEGFGEKAKDKGLKLIVSCDKNVSSALNGDPLKLSQVLVNLVSNALKFTEKGMVSLTAELIEDQGDWQRISFEVRDTGIGIAKEFHESVFQTFIQEDPSISRKYGGSGLGLSISRSIVRAMDSDIYLDSDTGEGAVFSFELLLEKEKSTSLQAASPQDDFSSLKKLSVLVAEDNLMNQMLISTILNKEEISFSLVSNGLEAIEALTVREFDLVLMDIQMPEMDGLTATKEIRERLKLNVPILALTANASPEDEAKYRQVGMNEIVTKPFKRINLLRKMADLVSVESKEFEKDFYSLDNILEMSGGDKDFAHNILGTFIENTPKYLDGIDKGVLEENIEVIRYNAHQLKPSLDILKMKVPLSEVLKIEKLIESGQSVKEITSHATLLRKLVTCAIEQMAKDYDILNK